ncbi:MAG: DUF4173 domain-containing protein [Ruminococcus sp.]|nr:DUF4173 domain-containing protein [Ruminococcus sp.]
MNNNNTSPVNMNTQATASQTVASVPYVPGVNPYQMPPVAPKKPKRQYSVKENIYAWLCFVLAYLFTLSVPIRENPFGLFVVTILMYGVTTVISIAKGKMLQAMPIIVGISAVVVSTSLVLNVSGFLRFFAFLYVSFAYCYYIYGLSGNNRFSFADSIVIDFLKALFVLPFYSFGDMFVSMFSGAKNKSGKLILKVLVGLGLAVIPTAIVLALLSYDSDFSKLMNSIFNFEDFDIFLHIVKLFFAVPLGAYAYGIYISSVDNKCEKLLTKQSCKKAMNSMRFAPAVTVVTAVLPVLFVYVVFFVSQWKYYVSGFTGVLPKGFSYAQYAREGFFQLCTVSVINLFILIAVSVFLKRKEGKKSILLKLISVIFSVFTLVLISTAIAKMVMYIDCYGLTPKRVYSTWLMAVLAIVFLLIILKQFIRKFRLIVVSLSVIVVMFSVLCLSGVENFIANYNVDRYINGTLAVVDVDALNDLKDASIEPQVRLYHHITDEVMANADLTKEEQEKYVKGVLITDEYLDLTEAEREMYDEVILSLKKKATAMVEDDRSIKENIWSFTLPSARAEKALKTTPFYGNSYAEELGYYWY